MSICNESGDIATSGCPSVSTKIMRKKSSADKLGEDKDGSEFKTWDADISITDTELSKLCTIHSAATKPSKVTTGTGSNKNNSKETTAASSETSGKTDSSGLSSDNDLNHQKRIVVNWTTILLFYSFFILGSNISDAINPNNKCC